MGPRLIKKIVLITLLVLCYAGCEGIRYSYIAPEFKGLSPTRKAAVFPVEPGLYPEAKPAVEKILSELVIGSKSFLSVINPDEVARKKGEEDKIITEYLAKLTILSYSDPDLSRKIGSAWSVDTIIIPSVEYWGYSRENNDKVAKVGISLLMIDTESGQIIWRAVHYERKKYYFFPPHLPDVTRTVLKKMIDYLPRIGSV